MSPWAFSLLLWASVLIPQASPFEASGTPSPDSRAPTALSGVPELSAISKAAEGGSTLAPVLQDTEAAHTAQEPIKITPDQRGTSSQPASNIQSTTNHQVFSGMTSKNALASGSSANNTLPTSTRALSNLNYSTSHSTSASPGSTPTLLNSVSNSTSASPGSTPTLLNSVSHSTSGSPHSTPAPPDFTHPTSQSTTALPGSSSVTSSSIDASLYKRKNSSDSTQAPVLSTSGPIDPTDSSMGALVPKKPLTTIPAKAKSSTTHLGENSVSGGGNSCPSRKDGLVSQCLIAIASLAFVATIFMVCTIILCTKLSTQKHRYRMSMNRDTEMRCISTLLPDGDVTCAKSHHPKCNGALIPSVDDSEGDDLTLHSFLPENERAA